LCGLCALYLHVGDHTGDRAALIIVSALIVSSSFAAELNLGPVQYLIWFDYWNISQMLILLPALAVALYEHRLFVSDQVLFANTLNKSTRWVFPFGFYPVLCWAMIEWGLNHHDGSSSPTAAFWAILIAGSTLILLVFFAQLRSNLRHEASRRERCVELLRSNDPKDSNYLNVLREAFVAFDTDDSGDISLAELRALLDILFPEESRVAMIGIMREARQFSNHEDHLDEAAFIDAVLMALSKVRGHSHDNIKYDDPTALARITNRMPCLPTLGGVLKHRRVTPSSNDNTSVGTAASSGFLSRMKTSPVSMQPPSA